MSEFARSRTGDLAVIDNREGWAVIHGPCTSTSWVWWRCAIGAVGRRMLPASILAWELAGGDHADEVCQDSQGGVRQSAHARVGASTRPSRQWSEPLHPAERGRDGDARQR